MLVNKKNQNLSKNILVEVRSFLDIIYKFLNVCPFHFTAFAVSGKVGYP